jgi:hypothetical protein
MELVFIAAGFGLGWIIFRFVGPLKDMKDGIEKGSERVNGLATKIEEDLKLFNKQRRLKSGERR